MLQSLQISNIRNISEASLTFGPSFNWFFGDNGAGKTSLLEAIHLICTGKSFRSSTIRDYIQSEHTSLMLLGKFSESTSINSIRNHEVSLKKTLSGGKELKKNGLVQSSYQSIISSYPIQVLTPENPHFVDGGPLQRRKFLDWGVFHVKHDYLKCWREFNKQLKQRNAVLKMDILDEKLLNAIDQNYIFLSAQVTHYRLSYWQSFWDFFKSNVNLMATPDFTEELELFFYPGWNIEANDKLWNSEIFGLDEYLKKSKQQDLRYRFTHVGPHKADIILKFGGKDANKVLSRGQKKRLTVWLKMCQIAHLKKVAKKRVIFLLDELSAELDEKNRQWLFQKLDDLAAQVFATSIELDSKDGCFREENSREFHVKHGTFYNPRRNIIKDTSCLF